MLKFRLFVPRHRERCNQESTGRSLSAPAAVAVCPMCAHLLFVTAPLVAATNMAPYSATETHNNRVTADSWIAFTPHRRRVTAILEKLGSNSQSAQRRLCVVGAGNLNDVELSQLQRIYAHIELIDIDLAALERGLRKQMVAPDSPSITLRGVDVLGLSDGAHHACTAMIVQRKMIVQRELIV